MYYARIQALEVGERDSPQAVMDRLDHELGVSEWWTPLHRRRPEHSGPRVTDDGLQIPSWWRDDETESQQWLAAQGVTLDG